MMKKPVLISLLITAVVVLPCFLTAQGIPDDPSDTMVPIDGGLSLLVAAALSYGSKKIYDARKK